MKTKRQLAASPKRLTPSISRLACSIWILYRIQRLDASTFKLAHSKLLVTNCQNNRIFLLYENCSHL